MRYSHVVMLLISTFLAIVIIISIISGISDTRSFVAIILLIFTFPIIFLCISLGIDGSDQRNTRWLAKAFRHKKRLGFYNYSNPIPYKMRKLHKILIVIYTLIAIATGVIVTSYLVI